MTDELEGFVTPINTSTNSAGVPIGGFSNAYSIAITPNGATAYVTNRDIDTVTPIDISTNTIGSSIPVGYEPLALAMAPSGSTAYVTSSLDVVPPTDGGITPIDTEIGTTGTSIVGVGGHFPVAIAITPYGTTAYVRGRRCPHLGKHDNRRRWDSSCRWPRLCCCCYHARPGPGRPPIGHPGRCGPAHRV